MCTISYVPLPEKKDAFIMTSNRDESKNRMAEVPQYYQELDTQLYYPKDKKAGGTWIGISQRKRLMSLMNGAFEGYDFHQKYGKSRGVVLKELLAAADLFTTIKNYNFKDIAPFYCVSFSWNPELQLHEIIWDGHRFFLKEGDAAHPKIWSSMMSYSPEQHRKKEEKFEQLLAGNKEITPELLWDFHHEKGKGKEEGILINRGVFQTTSISQFQHETTDKDIFNFENLVSGEQQQERINWNKEG